MKQNTLVLVHINYVAAHLSGRSALRHLRERKAFNCALFSPNMHSTEMASTELSNTFQPLARYAENP